jgi:hypothetical protein
LWARAVPRRGGGWAYYSDHQGGLIEAIGQDPHAVVMIATDAVFSTQPLLSLDIGDGLGQWEEKLWPDLFYCAAWCLLVTIRFATIR